MNILPYMNIGNLFSRAARYHPEKIALIYRDRQYTYHQADERINRLANAFAGLGIEVGSRVAILQYNCSQLIETMFAAFKAGLSVVPLNFRLHPKEIAYCLSDSESVILVFGEEFKDSIKSIREETPSIKHFVCLSNPSDGMLGYEKLVKDSDLKEPSVGVKDDELAWLFYTSGTTGKPKGAMLTHKNLMAMTIDTLAEVFSLNMNDVVLHVSPLTHGSGLYLFSAVAISATNIIWESRSFEPKVLYETIEKHKVTVIPFMVPTQIKMLLVSDVDAKAYDLNSLRYIVYGGSPMYVEDLRNAIAKFGKVFVQIYGQGESPMTISCLRREEHVADGSEEEITRLSSAGVPRMNLDVKVVDDEDNEVPRGMMGEIVVQGDTVMKGYWRKTDATAETLKGGWLHTGDIGYMDDYDYIYLLDRKKDLIISGGANIYPREVEEIITGHPAVKEVAVIGLPDPMWGESVKAIVVLKEGMHANEDEIIEFCKMNMAGYKKPRSVEFEKSLPKSGIGKILKRELKEKYWLGREKKV